jgi:hypothetical protein
LARPFAEPAAYSTHMLPTKADRERALDALVADR